MPLASLPRDLQQRVIFEAEVQVVEEGLIGQPRRRAGWDPQPHRASGAICAGRFDHVEERAKPGWLRFAVVVDHGDPVRINTRGVHRQVAGVGDVLPPRVAVQAAQLENIAEFLGHRSRPLVVIVVDHDDAHLRPAGRGFGDGPQCAQKHAERFVAPVGADRDHDLERFGHAVLGQTRPWISAPTDNSSPVQDEVKTIEWQLRSGRRLRRPSWPRRAERYCSNHSH